MCALNIQIDPKHNEVYGTEEKLSSALKFSAAPARHRKIIFCSEIFCRAGQAQLTALTLQHP